MAFSVINLVTIRYRVVLCFDVKFWNLWWNIWKSAIFIWFGMDNDDFCQEFKAILRPCIFNNYEFVNIPKIAKKSKISTIFKLCKHRNQRPNLYVTSRFLGKHCIWSAKAKNQETGLYIELRRTRGISIQGEVRNARKKRVTQQLLCSKF